MKQNFKDFMEKYQNIRVAIAVSGGMDSMYLMHRCAELKMNATVLTVDHGLRAESAAESEMVAAAAAKLGFEHVALKWTGEKPTTGIEEAARHARYNLMLSWCHDNGVGVLLLAHQADDQIETFLMHLGRGSGIYGLGGMRAETLWKFPFAEAKGWQSAKPTDGVVTIARPMLSITRAEIEKYIYDNQIEYVHDEMNSDEDFTRVRIRKNRLLLHDKLGISDSRILLAIEHLGRTRTTLEDDIGKLINKVCPPTAPAFAGAVGGQNRTIFSAKFLFEQPEELRTKFLSRLFQTIGNSSYPPRLKKVKQALILLNNDCKFTVNKCIVRRLENKILIAPEGASVSFRAK